MFDLFQGTEIAATTDTETTDTLDIDVSSPEGIALLKELLLSGDIPIKEDPVMMPSVMVQGNGAFERFAGEPYHRQQGTDWKSVSVSPVIPTGKPKWNG